MLDFRSWTWTEYKAVGRHAGNSVASAAVGAAAMGLLSQTDANGIVEGIREITSGVDHIVAGVTLLLGPFVPMYMAWRAKKTASPTEQTAAVVATLEAAKTSPAIATRLEIEDRNKLISAVGDMPEVKNIIADAAVAANTESPKVVATLVQSARIPFKAS